MNPIHPLPDQPDLHAGVLPTTYVDADQGAKLSRMLELNDAQLAMVSGAGVPTSPVLEANLSSVIFRPPRICFRCQIVCLVVAPQLTAALAKA